MHGRACVCVVCMCVQEREHMTVSILVCMNAYMCVYVFIIRIDTVILIDEYVYF